MEFDFCISNPAFNIASPNNVAGTGGNTTLYKTITRLDFTNRVKVGGQLINITLKGIIPDLVEGYFSSNQVDFIHLMDDVDAWPYNTCFFAITKKKKISQPTIKGGLGKKIFAVNHNDRFPFVYYSGSDSGMARFFGANCANKVIRRLPGKLSDTVTHDLTNEYIPPGWKFAFSVLESKKSYTVTSEPVFGGTICYVPTNTKEEAEKLKLFVENNPVFDEYVRRMKFKGKAFGLRHIKKFNLGQIVTGNEIPVEWEICPDDLTPPRELNNEIRTIAERAKQFGEVFTPTELVKLVLDTFEDKRSTTDIYNGTTFLDSMCGDGQFLSEVLIRKMEAGSTFEQALSTVYGVDIMPDNVALCRDRLLCGQEHLREIVERNIVCADALKYHYRFDGTPVDPDPAEVKQAIFTSLFDAE